MIGGFVEKQHIGSGDQGCRDRKPLLPSARERGCGPGAIREFGAAEHELDAHRLFLIVQREIGESGGQHGRDGVAGSKKRILGDVGEPGLLAEGAGAGIGRFLAGQDLEQGGFAAAIRTDETGAIAIGEAEGKTLEQGPRAERFAQSGAAQ